MLNPKIISSFKKDIKKYKHQHDIINELNIVLGKLLSLQELDSKYRDHALVGQWIGSRECHVKPDALLIYRIDGEERLLILERFGSHSELFK